MNVFVQTLVKQMDIVRTKIPKPFGHWHSLLRIFKFASSRALTLLFAVAVSVLLTIMVASKSGVLESEISGGKIKGWFSGVLEMGTRSGSRETVPYQGTFTETLDLLIKGLTLDLGETNILYVYHGGGLQTDIRSLILEFLSRTLLLFGTANVVLFFLSIALALLLYRQYGSFFDRLMVTLSPLSSVPAWLYGLLLMVFVVRFLHFYPGGILNKWPDELTWSSLTFIGKRMLLPVIAIFLSKVFQSIYIWRTFFLIHASEDYVDMAKAKGVSNKVLDRRYVVQPALPSLLTSFAVMITGIWQEAIVIELFFGVAGIGHLFYNALRYSRTEMPLLIGLTVTFAYLLAFSVFLLDIVYVLVDPRVRIEGQHESSRLRHKISWREKLKSWRSLFWRRNALSRSRGHSMPSRSEQGDMPVPIKTDRWESVKRFLAGIRSLVLEFRRYPSAVIGVFIVLVMTGVSIYTVIKYPYQQTIAQWRSQGDVWSNNPESAAPVWTNWFRIRKLAESKLLSTDDGTASKEIGTTVNGMTPIRMEFVFDYHADVFPTELILRLRAKTDEKNIFVSPTWIMPDGREITLDSFSTHASSLEFDLLFDDVVTNKNTQPLKEAWFSIEDSDPPVPLKGKYILRLDTFTFEPEADIEAEVILHGQLYGLAGTDGQRRDLSLALLWGTPIALTFGLVGALLASLMTMLLAAVGTWFGGWVDAFIQRLTEINMVLPTFPLLVLVYITISKNVWIILGLAVLLSMMSNAIKNYRAAFIQIKESAYIEGARAYGASNLRIVFFYLIPRLLPMVVPQLVSLAPGLVFLEATLAYLNISDPTLPTWGKLIQESISSGALNGAYYQVLEPVGLLLITGLALSMIGFALDRILNPRLREV